jgi:hypothetical protein
VKLSCPAATRFFAGKLQDRHALKNRIAIIVIGSADQLPAITAKPAHPKTPPRQIAQHARAGILKFGTWRSVFLGVALALSVRK